MSNKNVVDSWNEDAAEKSAQRDYEIANSGNFEEEVITTVKISQS